MGCDIHAMVEGKYRYRSDSEGYWISCGRIKMCRDYDLFARLGNVRNYNGIQPFGDCRFSESEESHPLTCEDWWSVCSEDFRALCKDWDGDGHSHSWVTLEELDSAGPEYSEQARKMVAAAGLDPDEGRLVFFFDN